MSLTLLGVGGAGGGATPAHAYVNSYSSVTNPGVNTDYAAVTADLGTAHSKRVIVVGVTTGSAPLGGVTLDGNAMTLVHEITTVSTATMSFYQIAWPTGSTGDIVIKSALTGGNFARMHFSVWSIYPSSATKIESNGGSATLTTPVTLSALDIVSGGVLLFVGFTATTGIDLTASWTGVNTPAINQDDIELEASVTVETGLILCTEAGSFNLSLSRSTSGTKYLIAATWGA